jgi:FixJ family two-component response regulator
MEQTIFVVDDDAAVRRAIVAAGKQLGRPVQAFASAEEFLAAADPPPPGCLVLDIKMPGMSGRELQQRLHEKKIVLPIIFVSGHADIRTTVEVMTRGAVTLLEKPFRLKELLQHLKDSLQRDLEQRERADRLASLTSKEREVLEAVAAGRTNKEIADELGLSLRAIEDRRARLMKKVQATSIAELVQLFSHRMPPA